MPGGLSRKAIARYQIRAGKHGAAHTLTRLEFGTRKLKAFAGCVGDRGPVGDRCGSKLLVASGRGAATLRW